ncbi:MAG: flagellar motor switch protein FliM [Planctomycetaceae bacterium]
MAHVLSQSEMESLMAGLGAADRRATPGHAAARFGARRMAAEGLAALERLHVEFAREAGAALSEAVRAAVEVRPLGCDQIEGCDLVPGLENPTCCAVVPVEPLRGPVLWEVSPRVAFPLLDRLLGGAEARPDAAPPRAATDVELKLLQRLMELLLGAWRRSWCGVCEIRTSAPSIETEPSRLQFVSPTEIVVLQTFEISLGEVCGGMNLAIPALALQSVVERLVAHHRSMEGEARRGAPGEAPGRLIELVVCLASTCLTTEEIEGLEVGDVITTDCPSNAPASVRVNGQPRFVGLPGRFEGRKAVRLAASGDKAPSEKAGGTV